MVGQAQSAWLVGENLDCSTEVFKLTGYLPRAQVSLELGGEGGTVSTTHAIIRFACSR